MAGVTKLGGERVALITGASGALGGELALQLARRGITPVLSGRTVPILEALYDRIHDETGMEPAILPFDLEQAHWQHYEELAETLENNLGRLDVLVHAAARFAGLQPLLEIDLNEYAKTLHVDLSAPYLLTRALAPLITADPAGQVLFVSDPIATTPKAYWGSYGIAKAGLDGLAGTLREELEHTGVSVHCVHPEPFTSRLRRAAFPAEPEGRVQSAEEAAAQILQGLYPG